MLNRLKKFSRLLKKTIVEWNRNDPFRKSAVLSFYAILSLPSLMMIIVWLAGRLFGRKSVEGEMLEDLDNVVGHEAADYVSTLISNAYLDAGAPWYLNAIGIGILVFSATTLFFQFQYILNALWDVVADERKGIINLLWNRMISLALIFLIVLLMLASIISSSLLSFFQHQLEDMAGFTWQAGYMVLNFGLSLTMLTIFFTLLYKFFPDVIISWKMVLPGAVFTAILFTLGNYLLSIYFRHVDPSSNYGIAGVVVLLMVWINYTSLILLLGATFTKVYALQSQEPVVPKSYARWTNEYIHFHERNIFMQYYQEQCDLPPGVVRKEIKSGRYKDPKDPENSLLIWKRLKDSNTELAKKA